MSAVAMASSIVMTPKKMYLFTSLPLWRTTLGSVFVPWVMERVLNLMLWLEKRGMKLPMLPDQTERVSRALSMLLTNVEGIGAVDSEVCWTNLNLLNVNFYFDIFFIHSSYFIRLFQTSSRILIYYWPKLSRFYTNHVFRSTIFTNKGTDILHARI